MTDLSSSCNRYVVQHALQCSWTFSQSSDLPSFNLGSSCFLILMFLCFLKLNPLYNVKSGFEHFDHRVVPFSRFALIQTVVQDFKN